MRSIKSERGVLKLVHPGRYIEVHREPIRAAEVMRRNPRHCITRPDVFNFPWIVVKPESVLLPGSVFLIVPNRTIYDLLKAKGQSNNHSPFSQQNQSPNNNNHVLHHQLKQDYSLVSSYAEMSSRLQSHKKQHIKSQYVRLEKEGEERELVKGKLHIFNKICLPLSFLFPFSQRSPNNCLSKTILSPDWDETTVELWPKEIMYEDTDQKKMEQESLDESTFEFTPYQAVQYYQNYSRDINMGSLEMPKKDVDLEVVPKEQVNNMLKSCLRRPNSIRKSLNLKVSFNISIEKEE